MSSGSTAIGSQIISEQFMQSLMTATDDKSLQRLVEERAELVQAAGSWLAECNRNVRLPRSRGQASPTIATSRNCQSAAEFVAAVRGR